MKNPNVRFKIMEEKDFPLYYKWVEKDYIKNMWFLDGYQSVEKIPERVRNLTAESLVIPYLIILNEIPIGMIQSWRWEYLEGDNVFPEETSQTYGMDLFIGEEEYLDKGFGTKVMKKFCQLLVEEKGAKKLVIDPHSDNKRAIRCYEKVGFIKKRVAFDGIKYVTIMEMLPPFEFIQKQIGKRDILFETKRCFVFAPEEKDLDDMILFDQNPEAMKYIGKGRTKTEKETFQYLKKMNEYYQKYKMAIGPIFEKSSMKFMGRAGLVHLALDESLDEYEVSYGFIPQYWRQGFATEICKQIVNEGFQKHSLKKILGVTYKENINSIKTLEKSGFTYLKSGSYQSISNVNYYQIEKNIG